MHARLISAVVLVSSLPPLVAPVQAQVTGIREVAASERSLIPLQTRVRYTTMIVLPEGETILDVICGDKDFWIVSATQNVAHVKPAKEGASTNLNLVTDAGTIYSFLLTEKNAPSPDLKVYVAGDTGVVRAKPKYYSAAQLEALQSELTDARAALKASAAVSQRHATEAIEAYQQAYPTRLRFDYGPLKYERPFLVRAIWHDGTFTYIRSDGAELPALYEMKDGSPSLVHFQVEGGTYVVPKLLESGYLALGKARFAFDRQGR
jgi:type IV secretory pathway VirB9-like protein